MKIKFIKSSMWTASLIMQLVTLAQTFISTIMFILVAKNAKQLPA